MAARPISHVVYQYATRINEAPPLLFGLKPVVPRQSFVVDPQPVSHDVATGTIESEAEVFDGFVPTIVSRFVEELRSCPQVLAVIVERGSNESDLHITTFAQSLTDDVREAVYSAERIAIDLFAPRTFNFHLRQPEVVGGQPLIPSATYETHLWRR